MEKVFLEILNRGITAGWLVLAVLVLRLVFRRAPKKFFVLFWGLVGLRLLIPFSLESSFSLVPSRETVPQEVLTAGKPSIQSGISVLDEVVNPVIGRTLAPDTATAAETGTTPVRNLAVIASVVWAAGVGVMLLYVFVSWLRIRRRVRAAVRMEDRIWACDYVDTPFILGVFRPRIYLPSGLSEDDRTAVTAHEKAHLARRDHLWKPLGFLLLSVFWFHPLLWAAYTLLCRDIEFACDEKVLANMELDEKKSYAEALLNVSVPRRMILTSPLAFGETGVKSRIRNVLKFRKATAGITAAAVLICVVFTACFMTDPEQGTSAGTAQDETQDHSGTETGKAEETKKAAKEETALAPKKTETESTREENSAGAEKNHTTDPSHKEAPENAAVPEEAGEAVRLYVTEILSALDENSTRHFEAEEFASIDGYIVAREIELRREFFKRSGGAGITGLTIAVSDPERMETGEDALMVQVSATAAYQFDNRFKAVDFHTYNVRLAQENGRYRCMDIISKDGYDRWLRLNLADLHEKWVDNRNLGTSDPDYIDYILESCYEMFGSGGTVRDVIITPMESSLWTQEDLHMAADAVAKMMLTVRCDLKEVYYAGDDCAEKYGFDSSAAWKDGETILMTGSFKTGDTGDGFDENRAYDGFFWIIRRNPAGGWDVWDYGY